jgi:hypothetical protein
MVDYQGVYDPDGTLRSSYAFTQLQMACQAQAAQPSTDCTASRLEPVADDSDTFDGLVEAITIILANLPGGTRPPLTAEQQAAKSRVEQLAKQACQNVSNAGLSPQAWGVAVHKELGRLISLAGNPKLFSEVGYVNGRLATRVGTKWESGSSVPMRSSAPRRSSPSCCST